MRTELWRLNCTKVFIRYDGNMPNDDSCGIEEKIQGRNSGERSIENGNV
jgi:hypothetical protein